MRPQLVASSIPQTARHYSRPECGMTCHSACNIDGKPFQLARGAMYAELRNRCCVAINGAATKTDNISSLEIKADGYRAQLHLHQGHATVYSRAGYDWTERFSSVAAGADQLKANGAIIDGEAVAYGAGGVPDFQQLRRELGAKRSERVRYHAFGNVVQDVGTPTLVVHNSDGRHFPQERDRSRPRYGA